MRENDIESRIVARIGDLETFAPSPAPIFADTACEFLSELSSALLGDRALRGYPDVASFAYWCRKSNISGLKASYASNAIRVGRGAAFHIAPSNVPINAFFSFAFSLLAGNSNIVRLPGKNTTQADAVCAHIGKLLPGYPIIKAGTAFVQYGRGDETTAALSMLCDVRIVWGGDATVASVRQIPLPPRAVEALFPDRYSLCVLSAEATAALDDADLAKLAKAFCDDAYYMDQNACSSPHLVSWLGEGAERAASRFWSAVHGAAEAAYGLTAAHAADKYLDACLNADSRGDIARLTRYGNYVYVYRLNGLPGDLDALRGRHGSFFETRLGSLGDLAGAVSAKCQTMTYFGIDKQALASFVLQANPRGIDRIVPVGTALDIGLVWDGYDLISALSRIVDIQ